jgi:CheY-like chemotaxis protein/GAF domain-containing protein/PAS domain-containing protein
VGDRPRILVLAEDSRALTTLWPGAGLGTERVPTLRQALETLRREHFDALVVDPNDSHLVHEIRSLLYADHVLMALPDGVALLDGEGRVRWANRAFQAWCDGSPLGREFHEALGAVPEPAERDPVRAALEGTASTVRLPCRDTRCLELHLTPVRRSDGTVDGVVALAHDVSQIVYHEQQLSILRQASQMLTALPTEDLAELGVPQRIELLTQNIRRCIHDLLHYEQIEIRLLDPQTGRLEPLLQEGMTPEAMGRVLVPAEKGQGVTGHVAATRKGYLCPDTARDPLYLRGGQGCRSSMTVPLLYQDTLIGTFNVESPRLDAFSPTDLQFLELFGREIANALHTLELLNAEKVSAASASIEAVRRQVALPVDDILAAATTVLERYIGHEPEMAEKLRQIIAGTRSIRQVIQKVGEDIAPPGKSVLGCPSVPAALRGLRVLVADSDERVRLSAHNILGRWGCIVETARDGQEAITLAKLSQYDAVLVDIRLPDMSGYDAYRELRKSQPQARVVLMTGYGYDPSHAIVKCRQDGLRHVLFKPFRVDQLLTALTDPAETTAPRAS